jgi:hypothetical protein
MLTLAPILFAVGALGGLTLAFMHIKKGTAPIPLALLHGALVATALVLLIISVLKAELGGLALLSIALFVAAALGGLMLFANHLRARPLPKKMIIVHGGVAATAFVILLVIIFV